MTQMLELQRAFSAKRRPTCRRTTLNATLGHRTCELTFAEYLEAGERSLQTHERLFQFVNRDIMFGELLTLICFDCSIVEVKTASSSELFMKLSETHSSEHCIFNRCVTALIPIVEYSPLSVAFSSTFWASSKSPEHFLPLRVEVSLQIDIDLAISPEESD